MTASKAAVLKGTERQSHISDSCPRERQIEHRLLLRSQPTWMYQHHHMWACSLKEKNIKIKLK